MGASGHSAAAGTAIAVVRSAKMSLVSTAVGWSPVRATGGMPFQMRVAFAEQAIISRYTAPQETSNSSLGATTATARERTTSSPRPARRLPGVNLIRQAPGPEDQSP